VTEYLFTSVRGSFACMTRLARVVIPGLPHHVTQRGNRREAILFKDGDQEIYPRGRSGVAIAVLLLVPLIPRFTPKSAFCEDTRRRTGCLRQADLAANCGFIEGELALFHP
jgi:hypothetical protein